MINKMVAVFLFLLLASHAYAEKFHINKGASRCSIHSDFPSYIIPMRGTGYYWLEYIYDGFNGGKSLILLIKSSVPIFIDRVGISKETNLCKNQAIVDFMFLPEHKKDKYIDSFDCHILDDMALPAGEITFGYLSTGSEPGFFQSNEAWRAFVKSTEGHIEKIDQGVRVGCTVLPSVD